MNKYVLLTGLLITGPAFAAPVSPLQQNKQQPIVQSEEVVEPKKENKSDLLKSIDDALAGKFEKAVDYRPPLPLTQKAWSKQNAQTKAGNKIYVWQRGKTFKVVLREGMGTIFKLPDWDEMDQSVLADSVNFRQQEMNNKKMLYVEALSSGADTSLTIIGKSGNIYNFYLASENVLSENISDQVVYLDAAMPSVKNFFENTDALVKRESLETLTRISKDKDHNTWLKELKFDPTKIRHDVEMRGDRELAPVLAFRDDRFTYLDYGIDNVSKVWPVAYQVIDKVDQPVNVRKSKDGRYMVIETINPITLRYGDRTVCLRRSI